MKDQWQVTWGVPEKKSYADRLQSDKNCTHLAFTQPTPKGINQSLAGESSVGGAYRFHGMLQPQTPPLGAAFAVLGAYIWLRGQDLNL